MLGLFAAFHGALNRTKMAELLTFAGVRKERGRLYGPTDLAPFVEEWSVSGLLVPVRDGFHGLYRLPPVLFHPLFALLRERGQLRVLADAVRSFAPLQGRYGFTSPEALEREIVLSLYLEEKDPDPEALCKLAQARDRSLDVGSFLARALGAHVPAPLLARLGLGLSEKLLAAMFEEHLVSLHTVGDGPLAYVSQAQAQLGSETLSLVAAYLALRGEQAGALLAGRDDAHACAGRALIALTRNSLAEARAEARLAIEHTRAKTSKKLKGNKSWLASWSTLALLTDTDPESLALARAQLSLIKRPPQLQSGLHDALLVLASSAEGLKHAGLYVRDHAYVVSRWDELLFWGLVGHFVQAEVPSVLYVNAKQTEKEAKAAGFMWVAAELSVLPTPERRAGLIALHQAEEPWQRALRVLEGTIGAVERDTTPDGKSTPQRLVWTLVAGNDGEFHVAARVQTATAAGWSGGRQVTWKKLFEAPRGTPWLSEADALAIDHIKPPNPREYELSYQPDGSLPLALIGHPRVFADHECRQPVEVARGSVRLEVQAEAEAITVRLSPRACHVRELACERDGPSRVLVFTLTTTQRAIAEQLGDRGLQLPAQAREAAQRVLARLVAHFPISSQIGIDAAHLEEVAADARIHVGLARTQSGLRVRPFVAPIGAGQSFAPGEGSESVLGAVPGEQGMRTVRATRDLAEERQRYEQLIDQCPALSALEGGLRELRIDDVAECLELLIELRRAENVVLAWTEGAPLELAGERELRDVRLRLRTADSWLSAEGEIEVDQGLKLTFQALLASRERKGRFVLLDDGRYLALTDELTRTLDLLTPLARVDAKSVDLHPLALLHLTQLGVGQIAADDDTKGRLERIRESSTLAPAIPPAFEATLRPYQEEGYAWLSRLAHWGGGACLADDMGLGKTLQTLALLVEHADRGPSLVVAPTSVCENWLTEARRFAPTLRVARLASDREKTLRELGPHDVLVCSYGLLQQEIERLEKVQFQVVVLDEAQAIKNLATLRTKAALRLSGTVRDRAYRHARGEPPGRAVQPDALPQPRPAGDRQAVRGALRQADPTRWRSRCIAAAEAAGAPVRAAPPQERGARRSAREDSDHAAHRAERRGAALYAALREQALSRVATPGAPADGRMRILAELMKLRRAACHPQLVMHGTTVASSKLAAFEELVDELRQGGHRALVFSQFVDHLTIVQGAADDAGHSLSVPGRQLDSAGARPGGGGLPGGPRRPVPDQPEGRRLRSQPDVCRLRGPPRSVVEPGRGRPGLRPRAPHRPDPPRDGLPVGHAGQHRGEDPGATRCEARPCGCASRGQHERRCAERGRPAGAGARGVGGGTAGARSTGAH